MAECGRGEETTEKPFWRFADWAKTARRLPPVQSLVRKSYKTWHRNHDGAFSSQQEVKINKTTKWLRAWWKKREVQLSLQLSGRKRKRGRGEAQVVFAHLLIFTCTNQMFNFLPTRDNGWTEAPAAIVPRGMCDLRQAAGEIVRCTIVKWMWISCQLINSKLLCYASCQDRSHVDGKCFRLNPPSTLTLAGQWLHTLNSKIPVIAPAVNCTHANTCTLTNYIFHNSPCVFYNRV